MSLRTDSPRPRRRLLALVALATATVWVAGGLAAAPALAAGSGTVVVTVTDGSNSDSPLANVGVELSGINLVGAAGGSTGVDGSYEFDNVPFGPYTVFASLDGYTAPGDSIVVDSITIVRPSISLLPANSGFTGTVTGPSGEVLSNPQVFASKVGSTSGAVTSFDPDGKTFTITGLAAGSYTLYASAVGYIPQTREVDLAANSTPEEDFSLAVQPVGTVTGRVTDSSGHGINHIAVSVLSTAPYGGLGQGETDADGNYTIPNVATTTNATLSFFDAEPQLRNPSYEALYLGRAAAIQDATTFDITDGGIATENIHLGLGATITGHVTMLAADGSVDLSTNDTPGPTIYQFVDGSWVPFVIQSAYAGNGGPSDISAFGMPPGSYKIGYVADPSYYPQFTSVFTGGGSSVTSAIPIQVTAGELLYGQNFTLSEGAPASAPTPLSDDELSGGASLDGTTVNQNGEATITVDPSLAGAWVSTWAHSTPTQLGSSWVQVGAGGIIHTAIGSEVALGDHTLVVQSEGGTSPIATGALTVNAALPALQTTPKPTISGSVKVGRMLTAKSGTWKPTGVKFIYQWRANGIPVPGGAASTYRVGPADRGKRITVAVTGYLAGHSVKIEISNATAKVATGTLTSVTPKVTGTHRVGHILMVTVGSWKPTYTGFTYTWLRNGKAITGAKTPSYTLTSKDKGKEITVKVTGIAVGYATLSKTSSTSKSRVSS